MKEAGNGITDMVLNETLEEIDRAFETEQVPWLEELVNQPSHTQESADVEKAASIIEGRMREIGMGVTKVPAQGFADHRVYVAPETPEDGKALLLAGHCDTVYPREQGFLHFGRDGDTIRGPGVLDMKSGLSVVVFALQAIRRAAPDKFAALALRFVVNTDEEVGSPDSAALYGKLSGLSTHALVFEGGREGDHIITSRKGTGGLTLRVTGVGAHAGNQHEDGVSAIHALSLIIQKVEAFTDYAAGTTVNVGLVKGGTSKNTVPESAECGIDIRVTSREAGERVMAALENIASDPFGGSDVYPPKLGKVGVQLENVLFRPPMESTPASKSLRETYETFAQREGLGTGAAPLQGGGSDANLLSANGVPCIDGLGPYGKFMHSPKEWSSLESLRKKTRALAGFLLGV